MDDKIAFCSRSFMAAHRAETRARELRSEGANWRRVKRERRKVYEQFMAKELTPIEELFERRLEVAAEKIKEGMNRQLESIFSLGTLDLSKGVVTADEFDRQQSRIAQDLMALA